MVIKILKEVFQLYIDRSDFFLEILLQHMMICGIAIVIASIIGILLGIIISEFKTTTSPVLSLVNFIYTIPSIALLGFFIPISGIGDKTAIIALTIYALLPMVRSTYTGIETIDSAIIESAKGMGSTDYQILYKIKLPLATTVILSGLRNMVVMTIALGGIASFIGAGGLGVAIYRGITTNNAALTVSGSLLIAVLALVVDLIIGLIEKFIKRKWKLN
ncbi:ABC transporter permease [Terrisporobacter glycolicus]|uniref:ABC transporter permease n=1 Tax=Terrisporobacter glycolicus TaxID=36841 RepID=UPI001FA6F4EF|nr:ABC transporter permease [Terrisporobacter glycolicus]